MVVFRPILLLFYLVFSAILLLSSPTRAQQVDDSNTVGLPTTGSFHGGGIDVVMLQNGNLHINIPVWSVPQRGSKPLVWNFIYDTPTWTAQWNPQPTQLDPNNGNYRIVPNSSEDTSWRLTNTFRYLQFYDVMGTKCPTNSTQTGTYRSNYRLVDPDGSMHSFPLRAGGSVGAPITFCQPGLLAASATDGSGIYWDLQSGKIVLKDGSQLTEDTNGNLAPSDNLGRTLLVATDASLVTYTTPLGATLNGPAYTTWVVKDSSGNPQTFRLDYGAFDGSTSMCSQIIHGTYPCTEYAFPAIRPVTLTLPSGQLYRFTWMNNSVFELLQVDLPTGGSLAYTYGTMAQKEPIPSSSPGWTLHGYTSWNLRKTISTRTVTSGSQSSQWSYAIAVGVAGITNPDGSSESHTFSKIPVGGSIQSAQRVETSAVYKSASGATLRTVAKDWAGEQGPEPITNFDNLRIIRETTTLDDGTTTKVETDYDTFTYTVVTGQYLPGCTCTATRTNPLELREFAYGSGSPGALLRKTDYTYLHISGPNASTYVGLNIVNRVASKKILDSSGAQVAQTVYEYDNYGRAGQPMVASSAVQHDSAFGTTYIYRGNVTAVSRWRNTDGALLTTANQYDDAGNLLSSIDPLGHKTSYDYTDSWNNTSCPVIGGGQGKAYVTTITNALGQTTTKKYNSCTGTTFAVTDPNLLTTTSTYDLFNREVSVSSPDGGSFTTCYTDTGGNGCAQSNPLQVVTTKTLGNGTNPLKSTTVFDGLARVVQTQLNSDPQGTVYTDTTYDALGRISTVSNPHRTCGSDITSSCGATTYAYDALGRKTSETYPDNSVLTTAYCGPSTLVTDPTSRWRRSRVDALGRLVEVDEPNSPTASVAASGCPGNSEPIWVTSYGYNTLGDLTSVVQNGSRQRNFTYDSLSHLLTSSNPEAGTITYAYNNDGILISKTDARSITTNYSPASNPIDALHRVTGITYSNADPSVIFVYDQTNCLGLTSCSNIGHRTSMTDAAGSELWAYQVDAANTRSLRKDQRTTDTVTKTATYVLDLAGNVTQVTYPNGRILNYTFDSANRPSSLTDSINGITVTGFKTTPGSTCIANVTCYTPQGTFYAVSIGQTATFNGLNLTQIYNNRLQSQQFKASSSGGNAIDITYSYADPLHGNKNAGHVFSITNNLDSTRSQNFTYDQLNRITGATTASTFSTSPSHCWGEAYGLDAWANLQSISPTTLSGYTGCSQEAGFSQTANTSNRLSGFSYDASGNASGDGVNSYTWNAESQLTTAAGVTYRYDGDGRRVSKVGSKLYWYGLGGEILAETNTSGTTTAAYIYFGGKRVATVPAGGNPTYYVEDMLETSRVLTTNTGTVCYDADFYPYGGERAYITTCQQNYKFEGKERDTETGNDDFGARSYSNRYGRWLSSDWSATPVAVPYANLSNPQTLNLYSMVADDPESFADLDGHQCPACEQVLESPEGQELIDHAVGIVVAGATAAAGLAKGGFDKLVDMLQTASDHGMRGGLGPYTGPSFNVYKQAQQDRAAVQAAQQQQSQSTPAQPPNQQQPPEQRDRYVNPGHHDPGSPKYVSGKTPLPRDAESTYGGAVKDTNRAPGTSTTYYGKTTDGRYYRYQGQNGEVHWNGEVKASKVPKNIRTQLDAQR